MNNNSQNSGFVNAQRNPAVFSCAVFFIVYGKMIDIPKNACCTTK